MKREELEAVRKAIREASLVLIGASNGLDMAEGLNIFAPDAHYLQSYGDLAKVSGARCILEGLASATKDPLRSWAWGARFARLEWLGYESGPVMEPLRTLLGEKDAFAITSNIDSRLKSAGFSSEHVLETEGSVSEMVCSSHCREERYPSEGAVRTLDASIAAGRVDASLIPVCPHCGAPLELALDEARMLHPDAEALRRLDTLRQLCDRHKGRNIVVLELGVGRYNVTVKQLLAKAVAGRRNVTYVVFNYSDVVFPAGFEDRCIGIGGDMAEAFQELL